MIKKDTGHQFPAWHLSIHTCAHSHVNTYMYTQHTQTLSQNKPPCGGPARKKGLQQWRVHSSSLYRALSFPAQGGIPSESSQPLPLPPALPSPPPGVGEWVGGLLLVNHEEIMHLAFGGSCIFEPPSSHRTAMHPVQRHPANQMGSPLAGATLLQQPRLEHTLPEELSAPGAVI